MSTENINYHNIFTDIFQFMALPFKIWKFKKNLSENKEEEYLDPLNLVTFQTRMPYLIFLWI